MMQLLEEQQGGGLMGRLDAFGYTGTPSPISNYNGGGFGGGLYDWISALADDELPAATKRPNLFKVSQGLTFDSRTGYGAVVDRGLPTFNFRSHRRARRGTGGHGGGRV